MNHTSFCEGHFHKVLVSVFFLLQMWLYLPEIHQLLLQAQPTKENSIWRDFQVITCCTGSKFSCQGWVFASIAIETRGSTSSDNFKTTQSKLRTIGPYLWSSFFTSSSEDIVPTELLISLCHKLHESTESEKPILLSSRIQIRLHNAGLTQGPISWAIFLLVCQDRANKYCHRLVTENIEGSFRRYKIAVGKSSRLLGHPKARNCIVCTILARNWSQEWHEPCLQLLLRHKPL